MIDELVRLIRLLEELDDESFEFDVERSENAAPGRSGDGRRSSRGRPGREKFEARRKVKKINRMIKKLERGDDADVEDLFEPEPPNVRVVGTDAGKRIVVDAAGAELDVDGDEIVVTVGGHTIRRTLDGEPKLVERTEKLGTTVFDIDA